MFDSSQQLCTSGNDEALPSSLRPAGSDGETVSDGWSGGTMSCSMIFIAPAKQHLDAKTVAFTLITVLFLFQITHFTGGSFG